MEEAGLNKIEGNNGNGKPTIAKTAIDSLVRWYCRESGVRNLENHIAKICRKLAYVGRASEASEAVRTPAGATTRYFRTPRRGYHQVNW